MATHAQDRKKYLRAKTAKRIALMKALASTGIAQRVIGEKFGISQPMVAKYLKVELPAKWLEFEEDIRKSYMLQDFDMMQNLYKELKLKLPKAKFRDIVELFKTVRTVNQPKQISPQLQQTNIKFEITDGTDVIEGQPQEK